MRSILCRDDDTVETFFVVNPMLTLFTLAPDLVFGLYGKARCAFNDGAAFSLALDDVQPYFFALHLYPEG